jgi:RNA polymerase sigma factor (sigma-70 family)
VPSKKEARIAVRFSVAEGNYLMVSGADHGTSPTLLSRLRRAPQDQCAWQDFVGRYGGMVARWCRQWGLQNADAEDVSQNVLLELSRQMSRFRYDPSGSFRGWLKTISYRAWCDFLDRRRVVGTGDSNVLQVLHSVEARQDFLKRFEEEWDRELLEEAMKAVQQRVQSHTWEAFRLMTQEDLSGQEVAQRLGMKVGAVWVAKSKVQRMLHEEIRRLDTLDEPS